MTTWSPLDEYATNLLPYSEDFYGYWTQLTGGNVIGNSSEGPFGEMNASLVEDNSNSGYGQLVYEVNISNNNSKCFSLFIKKDTDETRIVGIRQKFVSVTDSPTLRINTYTGDYYVIPGLSEISIDGYGVDDYGTYWRAWITTSATTLLTYVVILPALAQSLEVDATNTIIGSVIIFGAQLEYAETPTGYIKTDGEAVTVEKRTEWAIA